MGYLECAQFYDLFATDKEQEKAFYRQIAQEIGSPALELGVGTGIFAFLLANDGIEVVGIDSSPYMLKEAQKKLKQAPQAIVNRLTFLEADMTKFQLDRTFQLIYIPSESFQYAKTRDKQISCLRCVRSHLHPQGRFVFDVWVGSVETSGAWRRLETVSLPNGGVTRSISSKVLKAKGIIDTALRFDVYNTNGQLQQTYFDWSQLAILTVDDVKQLLGEVGLRVEALYSSFTREPWAPSADHAIFITRKAAI